MSALAQGIRDYLALRQGLGFKLSDTARYLPTFARFLDEEGASYITTPLAIRWATQPATAGQAHWARRLTMVRLFALYWSAHDPRTEVPPAGAIPGRWSRIQPYLYSDDEIRRLIHAARRLGTSTGLRPETYATLFGLLVVTGMRIGEVIALDSDDVDLDTGVLTIRRAKFGKSRLVPVHDSTRAALRRYALYRARIYPRPSTPSFFLAERGHRPTIWAVRWTFVELSHKIGLRGPADTHGPRLHDFRHRFAVQALLGWYRAGIDVEQRIPHLSTYLGHTHVTDTYWYLSAVPELMQLVAARLEDGP
jgi:integrase